ncbi:hypothetical protein M8C21_005037 [Ambrosia artemisiifolia]|uniref:Glycosyltransferase n=1 Tax=Ambrosia artemisiifolia TaxID=4212 RepID=A0AAD5C3S2_AMBAR|nr:hypothetical protein M8C21_005037 [Ambrosia artemisiifolia]
MIPDAYFNFAVDIAIEASVPVFCFETVSPCCLWTSYLNLPTLIEAGVVPFKVYYFTRPDISTEITEHEEQPLEQNDEVAAKEITEPEAPKVSRQVANTVSSASSSLHTVGLWWKATVNTVVVESKDEDDCYKCSEVVVEFRGGAAAAVEWWWNGGSDVILGVVVDDCGGAGNDLDQLITSIPGTEHIIRRRDLASFCRSDDLSSLSVELIVKEAHTVPQAQGLILNTFEELDSVVLPHIRKHCPNIYTIGPLHTLHKTRLMANTTPPLQETTFSNSVWKEDVTCLSWLDKHDPKTVIYISIGSLAIMTIEQLVEIWYGVVNSGKPFLWVRRPGSIIDGYDESQVPAELLVRTQEIGCIVEWAPQEDVLAHPAIGGFFTHSGWNSTMESIVQGLPMVCWPYFADQLVNSPMHSLHKTILMANTKLSSQATAFSNSVWKEDKSCMSWLDKHDPKTVIYVSIGSLAIMTVEELLEIWYDVVNSGHPFLWVRRPGSITSAYDQSRVPTELLERTKEIGRFVGEVWKIGVDLKDTCDRFKIEKALRDIMEPKHNIFTQSVNTWANVAKESISKRGSSSVQLGRLIEDILAMSSTHP